jgi:hypothetical protein
MDYDDYDDYNDYNGEDDWDEVAWAEFLGCDVEDLEQTFEDQMC